MMSITAVFSVMAGLLEHLELNKTGTSDDGKNDKKPNAESEFSMPTVAQVFGVGATKNGQTLTAYMRKRAKSSCGKVETDGAAHGLLEERLKKMYRPMKADGRDGSCAYNAVSQCLSGTEDYAAHLRLIAAVFCIERGWDGVHPSTKAYFASHQVHQYGLPSTIDLAIEILSGECADLQALAMVGGVLDMSILHLHPGGVTAKGLEDIASWAEVGKSNLDDFTAAEARLQNVYFIAPTGGSKKNPVRLVKSVYKGGRNKMASDIAAVDYGHYCGLVSVPAKNSSRKQRRARKNKPTLSGAGVGAGGEDDSVDLISKWCAMAKEGGLPGAILPSIAGMFSLRSEQLTRRKEEGHAAKHGSEENQPNTEVVISCGKSGRPAITTAVFAGNDPPTGQGVHGESMTAGDKVVRESLPTDAETSVTVELPTMAQPTTVPPVTKVVPAPVKQSVGAAAVADAGGDTLSGWMGLWFAGVVHRVKHVVDVAVSSDIVQTVLGAAGVAMEIIPPITAVTERVPEPVKKWVGATAGAAINTILGWTSDRVEEVVLLRRRAADFAVSSMQTVRVLLVVSYVVTRWYAEAYFLS